MSTVPRQSRGGEAVGRLLRSAWRYRWLLAAAVLLGALGGYGWAARQPTLYEGVTRVIPTGPGSAPRPGGAPPPPFEPEQYLRQQAQLISSPAVLERAVKLSGSSLSAEALGQRLEVDVAPDADVLTIRVLDPTATGAARLADAVAAAYNQFVAERSRAGVDQLRKVRSRLEQRLASIDAQLATRPNDERLRRQREAVVGELGVVEKKLVVSEAVASGGPVQLQEAAIPEQPVQPRPGRAMAVGMLVGCWHPGPWPGGLADRPERSPWWPLEGVEADHRAGQHRQGVEPFGGTLVADPQPPPPAQPRPGALDRPPVAAKPRRGVHDAAGDP
jgi:uncharacterized protein involved in exopolysaccharide biosynthesis